MKTRVHMLCGLVLTVLTLIALTLAMAGQAQAQTFTCPDINASATDPAGNILRTIFTMSDTGDCFGGLDGETGFTVILFIEPPRVEFGVVKESGVFAIADFSSPLGTATTVQADCTPSGPAGIPANAPFSCTYIVQLNGTIFALAYDAVASRSIGSGPEVFEISVANITLKIASDTPEVELVSPNPLDLSSDARTATIRFTQPVTGFELTDFDTDKVTLSNLQTSDNRTFTFDVVGTENGRGSFTLRANTVQNGSGFANTIPARFIANIQRFRPTITPSSTFTSINSTDDFFFNFVVASPEDLRGEVTASDFIITNATITGITTRLLLFGPFEARLAITPTGTGDISIQARAGAVTDSVGSTNLASDVVVIEYLTPTPLLTLTGPATAGSSFDITLTSNQDLDDASVSALDVSLSSASIIGANVGTPVRVSPREYTFPVTGASGDGTLSFTVDAGAVDNISAVSNADPSNTLAVAIDTSGPDPVISGLAGIVGLAGDQVSIDFGETVTGFELSDLVVSSNLVASSLSGGTNGLFTFVVSATGGGALDGAASLSLPAGVVQDAGGNANQAATAVATTAIATRPVMTFFQNNDFFGDTLGLFDVPLTSGATLQYSPGFSALDFTMTNATVISSSVFTFGRVNVRYTPTGGPVMITFPDGMFRDSVTGNTTPAFGPIEIFNLDATPPAPVITGLAPIVGLAGDQVSIDFGEDVTGFDLSDLTLVNLAASNLQGGTNGVYTFDVTPTVDADDGSIALPVTAASDLAGNANLAAVAVTTRAIAKRPVILVDAADPIGGDVRCVFVLDNGASFTFASGFNTSQIAITGGIDPVFSGLNTGLLTIQFTALGGDATIAFPEGMFVDTTTGNTSPAFGPVTLGSFDETVQPLPVLSNIPRGFGLATSQITVDFGETVTGFDLGDLTLTNLDATNLQGGTEGLYTFDVVATADGLGTIALAAGTVLDTSGNTNLVSETVQREASISRPTLTFASAQDRPGVGGQRQYLFDIFIPGSGSGAGPQFGPTPILSIPVTGGILIGGSFDGRQLVLNVEPTGGDVIVTIPEGIVRDYVSGNINAANAPVLVDSLDLTRPTITIAEFSDPPNGPQTVAITLSEPSTDFTVDDLNLVNATAALTGSGSVYEAVVTPTVFGPFSIAVLAGAFTDAAGNTNVGSNQVTGEFRNFTPVADFTFPMPAAGIPAIFVFTNTSTVDLLAPTPSYAWNFGDGQSSTLGTPVITYRDAGFFTITLTTCAGTLCDSISKDIEIFGAVPMTPTLSGLSGVISGPVSVTVSFSDPIRADFAKPLALSDFAVSGATLSNLSAPTGATPEIYTFDLTPTGAPGIVLELPAGVVRSRSNVVNTASNTLVATFDAIAPTIVIGEFSGALNGPQTALITLSEDSTDFDENDLLLVNATAALTGSGNLYTAVLTPLADGPVSLSVPAGAFTDAAGNLSTASNRVTAIYDGTAPDVTLTSSTDSFAGVTPFTITALFTEPVIGFAASDLSVTNGAASGLSGDGTIFTVRITPTGAGDVTIMVPAAVATDAAGNPNKASASVTVSNQTVAITQERIASFMMSRATALVANQPNLSGLFGSRDNSFDASVSRGGGQFDLKTRTDGPVWAHLTGSVAESGGSRSTYVLGVLGSHMTVHENLLIGGMVQLDYADEITGASKVSGTGWLAGPFLVARSATQPLVFEGSLLYGRSFNHISPFGTYSDSFETERLLATAKLTGSIESNGITWHPNLGLNYVRDAQSAYTDSLNNVIDAQTIEMTEATFGLDFVRALSNEYTLTGGITGIYSQSGGTGGQAASLVPNTEGLRARIDIGIDFASDNGVTSGISLFYDGIGANGYEAFGVDALVTFEF